MNRKPVNSMSLEMFTELANVIEGLEADPACQGMILTSVSNFNSSNAKLNPLNK
jgi:enoyl-CoA hydratase/carnithine racemase